MKVPDKTEVPVDPEDRAKRAEAALEEALAERNRLWEELHKRVSQERELEHYKTAYHTIVHSKSWRITAPLRAVTWFGRSIPELARKLRRYVSARPRHEA